MIEGQGQGPRMLRVQLWRHKRVAVREAVCKGSRMKYEKVKLKAGGGEAMPQ